MLLELLLEAVEEPEAELDLEPVELAVDWAEEEPVAVDPVVVDSAVVVSPVTVELALPVALDSEAVDVTLP